MYMPQFTEMMVPNEGKTSMKAVEQIYVFEENCHFP